MIGNTSLNRNAPILLNTDNTSSTKKLNTSLITGITNARNLSNAGLSALL